MFLEGGCMSKRRKRKLKKGVKIGIFVILIIIFLAGGYFVKDKLFSTDDSFDIDVIDSEEEIIVNADNEDDLVSAPVNYSEFKELDDGDYVTDKGYTLTIKDDIAYVDGYLIVNKTYALSSDYKPIDPYSGYANVDSCVNCIDKETMEAFNEMESDARSIGLNIYISSGYRSYNRQKTLYNNYSVRDGSEAADKYSARAGHSEHQTGYCFDLNTIDDSFAFTNEGKWVDNNAYLYGFIIRYPKGKEELTGYQYESWHLRYVGKDLAKVLYNNGDWITMEEYFGLTSKYNL